MLYRTFIRPLLFLISPEKAHYFTVGLLSFLLKIPFVRPLFIALFRVESPKLQVNQWGITFPNPVGLAAGFDKNAKWLNELWALGFGFIEIGTVTPKPQDGNPKPRMFRLQKDSALINRMGFNNEGIDAVVERLKNRPEGLIVGGNIGKNKVTPNENALDDYLICYRKLVGLVDYFVVNVSSPNTPNLRQLQEKEPLMHLLSALVAEKEKLQDKAPILLKIAPDLNASQLDDIIDIYNTSGIDGVIATNTTIDRANLQSSPELLNEAGGLSGLPAKAKSNFVLSYLFEKSEGKIPLIGVGGIMNADDAVQKMELGASLVQVYTGLIYRGPKLMKEINQELLKR